MRNLCPLKLHYTLFIMTKTTLFALAFLLSVPIVAQEEESLPTQLGEVVLQGNRLEVPFNQTARDIQIITQQDIQQLPVTSLNEVLSFISGVDLRQRGPFGAQTDVSIDGGSSEQTIVLINGVKMIDSQSAHNMMNLPVPLSAIAHIEVLRGAAARVYGINALTGAINIVTKKSDQPSLVAIAQGGSSFKSKEENDGSGIYAGGSGELTGTFGSDRSRHLLAAAHAYYNGQRYNSASKNTRLFYTGSYDLDSQNRIQAMAGYANSRFGANGFYAAPGDRESEEIVASSIFSLSSRHQLGDWLISPRISNRYGEDDYRYFRNDLSTARSLHYTNALMLELNSRLMTNIGAFGFGWESRLETINSSNIGAHNRDNHGLYGEWQGSIGHKWSGTIGIYGNYNTDYGWQVYPGLDLAYHINQNWKVGGSIGSGQRIPSFTDLYLDQRPGNIGNSSLQSENAWSYEGNLKYHRNTFQFQTGYFYRHISDFIDWVRTDPSIPYSPVNFGSNKMHGFHSRIHQHFNLGNNQRLGYRISYNYLSPSIESEAESQSKYVLESLRHQLITGVDFQWNQWNFRVENRWIQRELAAGYNLADIRVNYQLSSVRLFTQVTNFFNAQYSEAGAVPMPGRWFGLGIQYGLKQS